MWVFNTIFGKIFEFMFLPFRGMSPWVAMTIVSFVTGLLMLFIFRYTSNQEGIKRTKNKIKAHLLEMRLFSDNMGVSLKAQGNILKANLRYIAYSAKPMLFMIIPVILILVHINFWFGYDSLQPGEDALLKLMLTEDMSASQTEVLLEPSPGITVETDPLRIEEFREIDWRISATENGVHILNFTVDGQPFTKNVHVGQARLTKISPRKVGRAFFDQVFYPAEAPVSGGIPVEKVEIAYPEHKMNLFGWKMHWLIAYFALSVVFGFAFKGVFGVEI